MTKYTNVKVDISEGQKEKLHHAIKAGCSATSIRLGHKDLQGNDIIAVTNLQAKKLAKAQENGKGITIRMTSNQLKHNKKIEGGFLGLLRKTLLQTDLLKFFKPITETQKATMREITEGLKPIKEGIEAIKFPAYPSIQAFEKPLEGEETQSIGEVAEKYLRKFTAKGEADRTYGLYDKGGKFYIGNKLAIIVDNDLVVGKDEYEGTPGLWELIVSKEPKDFTREDYENYAKLMIKTNTLHRDNDPNSLYPKSSKSYKWNNILKDIWLKEKELKFIKLFPLKKWW